MIKTITIRKQNLEFIAYTDFVKMDFNTLKSNENRDVSKLKKSILKSQFTTPILAWQNYVADGTGRRQALAELAKEGYTIPDLPVVFFEAQNIKEAKKIVLMINSQHGEITQTSLADFTSLDFDLEELQELALSELNLEPLNYMLKSLNFDDVNFKDLENQFVDEMESDQREVLTQENDIYQISVETGNKSIQVHNLVCGSSLETDLKVWNADLVFTDPPYGVNITKASKSSSINNGKYPEIVGDRDTNFGQLFYLNCQKAGIKDYIIWGYNYFSHFLPPVRGIIVWDKSCPDGMSFADGEVAGIIARDADSAWISKDNNLKIYTQPWMGNMEHRAGEDNFVQGKRIHPTQKPIEVQTHIVKDIYPNFQRMLDDYKIDL